MNYTLHQLRIFNEIAEHQSITKAADALFLTQPAVSIQLKKLQDQFDIPITETVGKTIYLTNFGQEILIAVKELLELANNIQNLTLAHKDELIGQIKMSSVSTGKYILPFLIADFYNQNPGLELKMDVTNREQVISDIANNEVDFALVSIPPDRIQYESFELFSNKLVLVTSRDQDSADLFGEVPLIYREKGSGTRMLLEKFLLQNKIKNLKKIELRSNEAVKQAVLAGMGMSIMPLIGIKHEIFSGELKIIPIDGLPLETTWRIIWPKGKKHGIAASKLLEYLMEYKNQILDKHFGWLNEVSGLS